MFCKVFTVAGVACFVGLIVVIFAVYYQNSAELKPSPIVTTKNGKVQGKMGMSRGGKEYAEYLSIPFAEPPVGPLRFESPAPVKSWRDVKRVTDLPPQCAQMDATISGHALGQEDCLFLNVFTPGDFQSSTSKKKPVMVYIHGGAFMMGGSAIYDPNYFMDHDIVLVTLNYRLGTLGFLNTGDDLVTGNMGLKDQRLALRWVQANIASFGGDKNRVTLFGESAGAASVHFHLISKASKGLFQKAIVQSGTAIGSWAFLNNPKETALEYGRRAGCPVDNTTVLVSCLKGKDWLEVVSPQLVHLDPLSKEEFIRPSVESVIREDSFLTEHPRKSLETGQFSKVPVILGCSSGEGTWKSARFDGIRELIPEIDVNWEKHGGSLLYRPSTTSQELQKIRDVYFGTTPFSNLPFNSFLQNVTNMFSDALFIEPLLTSAVLHARHGAPTYLYYYDYHSATRPSVYSFYKGVPTGRWSFIPGIVKIMYTVVVDWFNESFLGWEGPHQYGLPHGEDANQAWKVFGVTMSQKDTSFSKKYVKFFADFAKNEGSPQFDGLSWPQVKTKGGEVMHPMKYMLLDKQGDGQITTEPIAIRMDLWGSMKLY